MMKATEQTIQQIERHLKKVAARFPQKEDAAVFTDIHFRVTQETGELRAFNDDDTEITRCVIEQWIDNKDDDFYEGVTALLRQVLKKQKALIEQMSILRPYSFVLEDDDKESVAELYIVDDDVVIIDDELMAGLDKDLNDFFDKLMKD